MIGVLSTSGFITLQKSRNFLVCRLWSKYLKKLPKPVVLPGYTPFEVLSSIDSDNVPDDQDEGEVLEVLDIKKKNDDEEYKLREKKNLNKYRDKSQFSNKSDMATFKGLKNEIEYKSDRKSDRKKDRKRKKRGDSSKSKSKSRMGYT